MQQQLRQIFHDTAETAKKAFPEKLHNLVVLSTAAETPVYVSPEMAESLQKDIGIVKRALVHTEKTMQDNNLAGVAFPAYPLGAKTAKVIALREGWLPPTTPGYDEEMRMIYLLDHELGHHIVENGYSSHKHLGESAADAFAALCHIQRYGMETEMFDYAGRPYAIALGLSPAHYTQAVHDRIKTLAQETDIASLSLRETARLAAAVAVECHTPPPVLDKVTAAFGKAAKIYQLRLGTPQDILEKLRTENGEAMALFVRETLEVARANSGDRDVMKAARKFLSSPDMKRFIDGMDTENADRKEALAFMKNPAPKASKPTGAVA